MNVSLEESAFFVGPIEWWMQEEQHVFYLICGRTKDKLPVPSRQVRSSVRVLEVGTFGALIVHDALLDTYTSVFNCRMNQESNIALPWNGADVCFPPCPHLQTYGGSPSWTSKRQEWATLLNCRYLFTIFLVFLSCNLDLCIFAQNVDIGVKTAGTAVLCCCPASQKGCKEGGRCHDYACLNLVPDSRCRDRCRWISSSGPILLLIQGPERSSASEHHKRNVLCGSFAIWRPLSL